MLLFWTERTRRTVVIDEGISVHDDDNDNDNDEDDEDDLRSSTATGLSDLLLRQLPFMSLPLLDRLTSIIFVIVVDVVAVENS